MEPVLLEMWSTSFKESNQQLVGSLALSTSYSSWKYSFGFVLKESSNLTFYFTNKRICICLNPSITSWLLSLSFEWERDCRHNWCWWHSVWWMVCWRCVWEIKWSQASRCLVVKMICDRESWHALTLWFTCMYLSGCICLHYCSR